MTRLLYHSDPLLVAFDATIVAHAAHAGRASVVLDQTALYPEAGGQMADRGTLAGLAVTDVQIDDAGAVHHIVDGALPAVGAQIAGTVDKARRRQHMALHTAQHMLSRALIEEAQAETVSARLGESVCTVDVEVPGLAESALAKAEALTNRLVDDDVTVRAFFPSPEELAALPLRRKPKVTDNIRVVDVSGFDVSPCGGTHCTHTSQVGLVRIVGLERYKGMMRVSFQAGPRARSEVFTYARTLEEIARGASASPTDVPTFVDKLRADLKGARDERAKLAVALADGVARALAERPRTPHESTRVVDVLGPPLEGDVDALRAVAAALSARGVDAVLATRTADGLHVLLMRAAPAAGGLSSLDCGALLKKCAQETGGKGGGKPERAEGRLPAGTDWPALIARLG